MTDDAIVEQLLGMVKPPDRGHVVESQTKAGTKVRITLPVYDLDTPWEDKKGGLHYSPHPSSGWYDSEKPLAATHRGFLLVLPGQRRENR